MNDQFVQGPLRLVMQGASIEVRVEAAPESPEINAQAEALALRYVDALAESTGHGPFQLLAEEQYEQLPMYALQNLAMAGAPGHGYRALPPEEMSHHLREARHRVTTYEWPLRECYDEMQDALGEPKHFFMYVYRAIEIMRAHLAAHEWRTVDGALGLAGDVVFLAKHANKGNERHAPRNATPLSVSDEDRARAYERAERALRGFENLCREQGRAG